MEVQWPEGLYDESSTHKQQRQQQQQDRSMALRSKSSNKGRSKGEALTMKQIDTLDSKSVK
jgi:hypothetical protein